MPAATPIFFVVKNRALAVTILATLVCAPSAAPADVTAADRSAVVERVAQALETAPYDLSAGRAAAKVLRARSQAGAYDALSDDAAFAKALTEDGDGVLHDKHWSVRVRPVSSGPAPDAAARAESERRSNYGIATVSVLPGNVGYLDVRGFADPQFAVPRIDQAMRLLDQSDALIIDLRRNGGGTESFARLMSWLLPGGAPQIVERLQMRLSSGEMIENDTRTTAIAGRTFADRPVWILTSRRTFSAAEAFTYHTRLRRSVRLVGETTGGGGHPNSFVRINETFVASIPTGRSWDPIDRGNWDGVGIAPDVATTASDAFKTAYIDALHAAAPRLADELQAVSASELDPARR